MTSIFGRAALAAVIVVAAGLHAIPTRAQTAYDVNRLNQAVQICNSPMGAGMAECAQLRARLGGGGGGVHGMGGLGGAGKAAGIASLLGSAMNAARSQQTPAAPPVGNPGAIQQAIAVCVRNSAGNNAAIQACLQIATAGQSAAPPYGGGQRAQDSAMATYAVGQTYQACVAANPGAWQTCLQTTSNNTQAGLLNAGVSPAQLQAAGGYVPPGYAPPASNPLGNPPRNR